jgi:hypothetical protein
VTALVSKSRRCISFLFTLVLGVLSFSGVATSATNLEPAGLEAGYRQMYNLDFDAAHQTFTAWEHAHPEDPLGPVSNAAAYLFAEFDRMHILESELFIDNARFEHRKSYVADVQVRNAFENELQRGEQAANRALERSPVAEGKPRGFELLHFQNSVSGLAPGSPAVTWIVGKSTFGRSLTGSDRYATSPNSAIAAINKLVAIGRLMKPSEMFTDHHLVIA